jgi:hypothetical protein
MPPSRIETKGLFLSDLTKGDEGEVGKGDGGGDGHPVTMGLNCLALCLPVDGLESLGTIVEE